MAPEPWTARSGLKARLVTALVLATVALGAATTSASAGSGLCQRTCQPQSVGSALTAPALSTHIGGVERW